MNYQFIMIIINSTNLLILLVLMFHHQDSIIDFRVQFILQDCPHPPISHLSKTRP
jgi:hypothetical protein